MLSFTIAHISIIALRLKDPLARPALQGALERQLARQAGPADRGARRDRHRGRLRLGGRPPHGGQDRRNRLDDRRDDRLLPLPPPPGARPEEGSTGSRARSGRSASSRSPTTRRWCRSSARASTTRRWRAQPSWSAPMRRWRPSTCSRCRASFRWTADSRRRSARHAGCSRSPACRRKVAGCRVRCRLIRTRNPGRAIVDEAKERRSDLIYISTEHAPSEERLLGPTTRYVLANRPCRVIVEHDPTSGARQPESLRQSRHTQCRISPWGRPVGSVARLLERGQALTATGPLVSLVPGRAIGGRLRPGERPGAGSAGARAAVTAAPSPGGCLARAPGRRFRGRLVRHERRGADRARAGVRRARLAAPAGEGAPRCGTGPASWSRDGRAAADGRRLGHLHEDGDAERSSCTCRRRSTRWSRSDRSTRQATSSSQDRVERAATPRREAQPRRRPTERPRLTQIGVEVAGDESRQR